MDNSVFSPNVKETIPLLNVRDLSLSVEFYVGGMEFEIINEWIFEGKRRWCMIKKGRAQLMLQEFRKEDPDGQKPEDKLGLGLTIYFICEDALSLYSTFLEKKLKISEPFVGNAMWVVELKDPDGYEICFESNTDVPEGTKYNAWK